MIGGFLKLVIALTVASYMYVEANNFVQGDAGQLAATKQKYETLIDGMAETILIPFAKLASGMVDATFGIPNTNSAALSLGFREQADRTFNTVIAPGVREIETVLNNTFNSRVREGKEGTKEGKEGTSGYKGG